MEDMKAIWLKELEDSIEANKKADWSKELYDKMRYDVSNGFTESELIEWYGEKNTKLYFDELLWVRDFR